MPIYLGSNEINENILESNNIGSVFVGNNEVWTNNKVIDLGTSTMFDLRQYASQVDYTTLTIDNFFFTTFETKSVSASYGWLSDAASGNYGCKCDCIKTYNSNDGSLTFYLRFTNEDRTVDSNNRSVDIPVHAFLVTKPNKLIQLTGTKTFDVTSYSGYTNFTTNNFLIKDLSYFRQHLGGYNYNESHNIALVQDKSYSNGILTCTAHSLRDNTTSTNIYDSHEGSSQGLFSVYLFKKGV